jgi:hypothetical protein
VPTEERVGLDVHQGVTPREQAAQNYHTQASGIIGAVWLHLTLLEKGEVLTQEEVLSARRDRETSISADHRGCDPGFRRDLEVSFAFWIWALPRTR